LGYEKWSLNPITNNYTIMAEYNDYGPGYNYTARILGNVTQVLNAKQASVYATPKDVFMTSDGSQPYSFLIDNTFILSIKLIIAPVLKNTLCVVMYSPKDSTEMFRENLMYY